MSGYKIKTSIRLLRFQNNEMTQQKLADKVKCTRQTIAALEQGQYSPSLILAYRISKVFGKSIEEVFEINDEVK
ncbi:MAG: helix-turn-helix transcriptional regulator [Actinomycetia bacterium]|nr:helix-turn-helix transcriptional regulator [Actinomycetes bacterium]